MKKILGLAGAIAFSIIPTPSFSGEVEQKEMMSVTEQLLPQIGEKYKNLNKKEKKTYKKNLLKYLKKVQKTGATGVGEGWRPQYCPPINPRCECNTNHCPGGEDRNGRWKECQAVCRCQTVEMQRCRSWGKCEGVTSYRLWCEKNGGKCAIKRGVSCGKCEGV